MMEIVRLAGWLIVIYLAIKYKKYTGVDMFWLRIIGAFLMLMGSVNDLQSIDTIHFKSLWWFFGNVFIIISYIYMAYKDFKDYNRIKNYINKT